MAQSTGLIASPYVSALDPNINTREIFKQIIDTNQDDEWLNFMQDAGKEVLFNPTEDLSDQPVYHSWYDDPLFVLIDTTGATVSGSGSATVTVTVMTVTTGILTKGKLLYFPDGKVARVQSATNDGFVAKSVDGSNLTLTAGMKLSAFSNAQEEGSDGADPVRWGLSALSNRIQIFQDSIQITDIQNMSGVEFEINGQNRFLPYQLIKLHQYHRGQIALAFWMGKVSTTLFSDTTPALVGTNGRGVQTTRGFDQYITDYGIADQVATPGTLTLADFGDLEAQLVANRAPKEFMVVGSQGVITAMSDFLKGLNSSGVTSAMLNVNGRELDFEVEKFRHGGFTFNLRMLNVLSNTSVINYVGTGTGKIDIANSAYFLPLGKVPTVKGSGGLVDYFRYRYMTPKAAQNSPNSTSNGRTVETMTGGLAPIPTGKEQTMDVQLTTNMGLEVFKPKAFAKMKLF